MNTIKIELDVPEALLSYVDVKSPSYQKKLHELMLYELIKDEKISFGKAAEILNTDKMTLIMNLGELGIPYFDQNIEEVMEDADQVKLLLEKGKNK